MRENVLKRLTDMAISYNLEFWHCNTTDENICKFMFVDPLTGRHKTCVIDIDYMTSENVSIDTLMKTVAISIVTTLLNT